MWRVGRKLGRTLYLDDVCVGMVDTPELAERIVRAMYSLDVIAGATNWSAEQILAEAKDAIRRRSR